MNAQAGHWFGSMQQLAAGFAGREAGAADITRAWRDALGAGGGNPLADMFRRMGGADARGVEDWMAQAAPFLAGLRGEAGAMLNLPAFGLAREHQERLQQLAQAQLAYQERSSEYQGQLARAAKLAFERFEGKLAEHSEPGRQIESARALFDLWIDAAEEAWAEVALSAEYRETYGHFVNAQMRLRAGLQREIELAAGLFGLPTRSEINASHRKLAALERELRALKSQLGTPAPRPAAGDAPSEAREDVAPGRRAGTSPRAAKKSARKPAPSRRAPSAAKRSTPATPTKAAPRPARRMALPQVIAPTALRASAAKPRAKTAKKKGR
jgi:class III poly(R)-hydroxyalkanoic acid synthase PhaE subunit